MSTTDTEARSTDPGRPSFNWRNTASRYGSISLGLHWLMLLLIAAVYACIELRGDFPKGSDVREGLKTWHFILGLSVLALVVVRAAAQFSGTVPRIEPEPSRWQNRFARLMKIQLYALMIGMPLLELLILSAEGKHVPFFGWQLTPLISESKSVAGWAKGIPENAGMVGCFLIGLHAAEALFHHHVVRDNTLRRMLPSRG